MAASRVTEFAIQADGSRSYGLSVRGIRVLVTAPEGRLQDGLELAQAISALGSASVAIVEPTSEPREIPDASQPARRKFVVGQKIRCIVHGAEGECTVTEVGSGRNTGRIKISNYRPWCPAYNFVPVD